MVGRSLSAVDLSILTHEIRILLFLYTISAVCVEFYV